MITKMRRFLARIPEWLEIVFVIAICFGVAIYRSVESFVSGKAFTKVEITDHQLFFALSFEIVAAVICLIFLYWRDYKIWKKLKFELTGKGIFLGIGLFFATYLLYVSLYILVITAIGRENFPIAEYVVSVKLPVIILVSLINPLFEETFVMGYIFDKLENHGVWLAISVSVLLRVSYHLYQGWIGIISIFSIGFIFALVYWRYRNLWAFYFAHLMMDFIGLASSRIL